MDQTIGTKKYSHRLLTVLIMITIFGGLVFPQFSFADEENISTCDETVSLLRTQNNEMNREFRQLKREMAVLKDSIQKPGIGEILGGIGYIFGLFGVAYYWQARGLVKGRK